MTSIGKEKKSSQCLCIHAAHLRRKQNYMDPVCPTPRSTHREEERKRTTHSVSALERRERGRLTLWVPWSRQSDRTAGCGQCCRSDQKAGSPTSVLLLPLWGGVGMVHYPLATVSACCPRSDICCTHTHTHTHTHRHHNPPSSLSMYWHKLHTHTHRHHNPPSSLSMYWHKLHTHTHIVITILHHPCLCTDINCTHTHKSSTKSSIILVYVLT